MQKLVPIAAALLLLVLATGCEVDSASQNIRVSPANVELSEGQSQEFTVSGGYDYRWSLANEGWGLLNPRVGARVVYVSRYAPAANAVQTITVTSFIEGSGADSNDTPYQVTGEAVVIHRGTGEDEDT